MLSVTQIGTNCLNSMKESTVRKHKKYFLTDILVRYKKTYILFRYGLPVFMCMAWDIPKDKGNKG